MDQAWVKISRSGDIGYVRLIAYQTDESSLSGGYPLLTRMIADQSDCFQVIGVGDRDVSFTSSDSGTELATEMFIGHPRVGGKKVGQAPRGDWAAS